MFRIAYLASVFALFAPAVGAGAEDARWAGRLLVCREIVSAKGVSKSGRDPGVLARLERRRDSHYVGAHVMTENGIDDREAQFDIIGGVVWPVGDYVLEASADCKFSTGMRAGYDRDMFEYRVGVSRRTPRCWRPWEDARSTAPAPSPRMLR